MRKNFIPMYEVGTNIVTEGEKTTPIYEVWKNIVTKGYVRKTLHQCMKYGKALSQRGKDYTNV